MSHYDPATDTWGNEAPKKKAAPKQDMKKPPPQPVVAKPRRVSDTCWTISATRISQMLSWSDVQLMQY